MLNKKKINSKTHSAPPLTIHEITIKDHESKIKKLESRIKILEKEIENFNKKNKAQENFHKNIYKVFALTFLTTTLLTPFVLFTILGIAGLLAGTFLEVIIAIGAISLVVLSNLAIAKNHQSLNQKQNELERLKDENELEKRRLELIKNLKKSLSKDE